MCLGVAAGPGRGRWEKIRGGGGGGGAEAENDGNKEGDRPLLRGSGRFVTSYAARRPFSLGVRSATKRCGACSTAGTWHRARLKGGPQV